MAERKRDRLEKAEDRLVAAACQTICAVGVAGASARAIAAIAGATPSAINYHFGGLEHLFGEVFRAAEADAAAWVQACVDELADLPPGVAGAKAAMGHAICSWGANRARAILHAEARARPLTEASVGAAYGRLFRSLFEHAASALDLAPPAGGLMHALFEALAPLHLSRWRPALEAAVLGELLERFAAVWIATTREAATPCPALERAMELCARTSAEAPAAALRIAEAAVDVVGSLGLEGLTHRSVAAAAGVTVGAVTHYYRTAPDLVAGALRGQVERLLREASGEGVAPTFAAFAAGYRARAAMEAPPAPVTARFELFLATLHRSDLAAAGAAIRYAHGATTQRMLAQRLAGRADAAAIATLISLMFSGLWRASAGAPAPAEERAALAARIMERTP